MPEYPLLVFPSPIRAERARRGGGGGNIRRPAPGQQAQRLAHKFERLQSAMEGQRVALRDNSHGLQPEKALVLETIGPIQDFIKAVKNVEGLEWMGEFEVDEILPAHGSKMKGTRQRN